MIVVALLLQAGLAEATAESRALYEPYRRCLAAQTALLAAAEGRTAGLDQARSRCVAQNLAAGSQALMAEIRAGVPQGEAVERVAALRSEIEREAIAQARVAPDAKPN